MVHVCTSNAAYKKISYILQAETNDHQCANKDATHSLLDTV